MQRGVAVQAAGARLACAVFAAVPDADVRLGQDAYAALCGLLGELVVRASTGVDYQRLLSLHCPLPPAGAGDAASVQALPESQVGAGVRIAPPPTHPFLREQNSVTQTLLQ